MNANDVRSPAARGGASEQPANYSVAGEEDPGASGIPGQVRVKLTDAELVQLQLRGIALENLVTALPRPDSTQHHLTVRAAAQMIHLLERSEVSKTGFKK